MCEEQSPDWASGAKIHLPKEATASFSGAKASEKHWLLVVMVVWERVRRGCTEDLSSRQSDPSSRDHPTAHPLGEPVLSSSPSKSIRPPDGWLERELLSVRTG